MGKLIIILLGIYSILDSLLSRGVPYWRVSYGIVFMGVLIVTLVKLARMRVVKIDDLIYLTSSMILICLPIISIFLQDVVFLKYVIGDFVTILFPVVLVFLGRIDSKMFLDRGLNKLLFAFMLLASLIAPFNDLWGGLVRGENRYDPPHVVLIAATWVLLLFEQRNKRKIFFIILLLLYLSLSYFSNVRTSILTWFIGALIFLYIRGFRLGRIRFSTMFIYVSMLLIFIFGLLNIDTTSLINNMYLELKTTRLHTIVEGKTDESFMGRLMEVKDVIKITKMEGSVLNILIGHGYGATFTPYYSYPEPNITEFGLVHNIHIGPVQMFYRYGLLGLFLFLYISFNIFKNIIINKRLYDKNLLNPIVLIYNLSLIIYFINFMLFNILIDPAFSYCLAGFLTTRRNNDD
ncbi:hypothetical protein BR63_12760 [Thermanaerosceptrum fracticalcis]|uniref:O-antigen ligase-related domain-containing protein n=1 Tax=Thermanaerosceptrum fracticalcis TaxID=1712410 RepID=A0A7G6E4U7_THEFR|nr:O-antigen ligase family protein [Thermanaerosceptrum fracticalcis]QNB47101.1 hypothetical protein BR63_12760 [Thermanaerosceptrum fracticalcis]